VTNARNDPGSYRLRVSLNEVAPAVWREMIVPAAVSLSDLHRILQVALGWWDAHLHDFKVKGVRYEPTMPESEGEPTETTFLGRLDLRPGDVFSYRYDFGDDWSHRIEVLAILTDDAEGAVPLVIAGENTAPLEDSGGPDGLYSVGISLTRSCVIGFHLLTTRSASISAKRIGFYCYSTPGARSNTACVASGAGLAEHIGVHGVGHLEPTSAYVDLWLIASDHSLSEGR